MRALVAGGTGVVGRALLDELSAEPRYDDIVSYARRHQEPMPRVRTVDLDATVLAADVAFCALGTTLHKAGSRDAFHAVDHDLVLRFAAACLDRGVRGFHVVSALGADPRSRIFYNRVKGEMERDVGRLGFRSACAYRPSLLMADRKDQRAGERVGIGLMRILGPVVPLALRGIPPRTVARAMARHALAEPSGWHVHENKDLFAMGQGTAK